MGGAKHGEDCIWRRISSGRNRLQYAASLERRVNRIEGAEERHAQVAFDRLLLGHLHEEGCGLEIGAHRRTGGQHRRDRFLWQIAASAKLAQHATMFEIALDGVEGAEKCRARRVVE